MTSPSKEAQAKMRRVGYRIVAERDSCKRCGHCQIDRYDSGAKFFCELFGADVGGYSVCQKFEPKGAPANHHTQAQAA